MTGKRTYKEIDTETRLGKKRFLERKIQDQEAEDEIKDYIQDEDCTDESGTYRFDGLRSERR